MKAVAILDQIKHIPSYGIQRLVLLINQEIGSNFFIREEAR